MLDLQSEKVLTLNEARRLPFLKGRRGNSTSISTVHRWSKGRGVKGVVLETAKIGGTVVTSVEAVLRFVERLNDPGEKHTNSSPAQRRRAIAEADKRLDAQGI